MKRWILLITLALAACTSATPEPLPTLAQLAPAPTVAPTLALAPLSTADYLNEVGDFFETTGAIAGEINRLLAEAGSNSAVASDLGWQIELQTQVELHHATLQAFVGVIPPNADLEEIHTLIVAAQTECDDAFALFFEALSDGMTDDDVPTIQAAGAMIESCTAKVIESTLAMQAYN